MENPIKMDDLGVPLFLETSISTGGGLMTISRDFILPIITGTTQAPWRVAMWSTPYPTAVGP